MKRLTILLVCALVAVITALTVGVSEGKAWCDHPSNPCHLPTPPPPQTPPPAPPPSQPARVGYCVNGQYFNIAVDEIPAYEAKGGVPAVEGACPMPNATEVVPPVEDSSVTVVIPPNKPKRVIPDLCPVTVPGVQGPNLFAEMQEHGWTRKHTPKGWRCYQPTKPPNEDLTG